MHSIKPFVYAFMQAITRNRAASVWIQPQEHGISGVSSPVEIQLRGLEGVPWGVIPEFVESTGREEYLRLHGEEHQGARALAGRSEPVPYIGIVVSEQTRTLYGKAALPLYLAHALGAFRALMETHVPVRLLDRGRPGGRRTAGRSRAGPAQRGVPLRPCGRGDPPLRAGAGAGWWPAAKRRSSTARTTIAATISPWPICSTLITIVSPGHPANRGAPAQPGGSPSDHRRPADPGQAEHGLAQSRRAAARPRAACR